MTERSQIWGFLAQKRAKKSERSAGFAGKVIFWSKMTDVGGKSGKRSFYGVYPYLADFGSK